jgi:hypothetical protein
MEIFSPVAFILCKVWVVTFLISVWTDMANEFCEKVGYFYTSAPFFYWTESNSLRSRQTLDVSGQKIKFLMIFCPDSI